LHFCNNMKSELFSKISYFKHHCQCCPDNMCLLRWLFNVYDIYLSVFHWIFTCRYSTGYLPVGIPLDIYLSVFHWIFTCLYSTGYLPVGIPLDIYLSVFHWIFTCLYSTGYLQDLSLYKYFMNIYLHSCLSSFSPPRKIPSDRGSYSRSLIDCSCSMRKMLIWLDTSVVFMWCCIIWGECEGLERWRSDFGE
jgi:hypothetical protein